MKLLVLNGPNLDQLGKREPETYGRFTLAELEGEVRDLASELGVDVECRQSNHEGVLIEWLHNAPNESFGGVVLNAAGYTHTSVALRDAVASVSIPVVEVHLTNVHAREGFRHNSLLSAVCEGTIGGFGIRSYAAAIYALARDNQAASAS